MSNFFDKALHFLGKQKKEIVALNIGAMDGVMFDEMYGYSSMYDYKVLYVEPIPYLFNRLVSNVKTPKSLFENSAISDYDGVIDMLTIDRDAIDNGKVHSCFYGMSAVYPPKNGLGSEFDKQTVDSYGKIVSVNCITFKTLLEKHNLTNFDIVKVDAEGHDYHIFKQIDLEKYEPKVIRLEWINLSKIEQHYITEKLTKFNYQYEINGQDITAISEKLYKEIFYNEIKVDETNGGKLTIVTGLWDIGRDGLEEGWSRSYTHYLEKFRQLLQIEENMIIFGNEELKSFVETYRDGKNTQFIVRDIDWFKNNDYYKQIQKIRTNPEWYNQTGWLSESTQARLDLYNPLVMSKMFLLHDAKIFDQFNSDYLFWLDAGITNTVNPGYFTHDKVFKNLSKITSKFTFICFPYETTTEIHGFEIGKLNEYAGKNVNKVPRGGFFGGPKESITEINNTYYHLLINTLSEGYMGTEESLFSILLSKYPELFNYFEINPDGLLWSFFESLKDSNTKPKYEIIKTNNLNNNNEKVGLYVIGFNSPKQFKTLIKSMELYDNNFLTKTQKFLINNSTDESTTPEYINICNQYNFEHIKHDNLGICGGRQWIAEHFEKTDLDFMLFFEDDMFFYPKKDEVCRNGFNRFVDNLYNKSISIMKKENLDFLKLNFSEFYGDNSIQWSWYNVPQVVRDKVWPNNKRLPVQGLDPNAPNTKFDSIKSYEGISYALGEVYYCNWPQIVSKEGNKKMFLTTKWNRPFEQTWMSYIYQETIKGLIKPAILLLTPTEHDRFDHYDGSLRKES